MKNLNDIIALGEGFTTEFKRSGTSHLGRELCAFANANGGIVLIGVADDGTVVGISDANRLKSEVQSIARNIEPPLIVDVEDADGVLAVTVPPQTSKPYSCAGKFYRGIHFAGLDPHVVVQGALWKRIQRIRKNWN